MDLSLNLPAITAKFENAAQVPAIINQIRAKYGDIIKNIAIISRLDEFIIYGFIFVESGGQENAISGQSVGLMQINPDTANTCIIRENINKGLSVEEKEILKKYLGDRLTPLFNSKFTWKLPANGVNKTDLFNPELNILIGAMYINQLIFKTKIGNILRLDHVIWKYNRGEFAKIPGGDVAKVYAAAGSTTGKYIRSLLGNNGILDQLT